MERKLWEMRAIEGMSGPLPGSRVLMVVGDDGVIGGFIYEPEAGGTVAGVRLTRDGTQGFLAQDKEAALRGIRDHFRTDFMNRSAKTN